MQKRRIVNRNILDRVGLITVAVGVALGSIGIIETIGEFRAYRWFFWSTRMGLGVVILGFGFIVFSKHQEWRNDAHNTRRLRILKLLFLFSVVLFIAALTFS